MKLRIEVVTLYRYFGYAAHMRDLFRKALTRESMPKFNELKDLMLFLCSPPGMYLLYSYSGIFLVIEGWRDLKLSDSKIDALLTSPFVDKLRRFRNATFHYQKEPVSMKHLEFFGTEEEKTEEWLNNVYYEFERFFKENTLPIPGHLKELLEGKSAAEIGEIIHEFWSSEDTGK